ncbi:hypothetical protein PVAG01_10488 [Phlyctema vagabunda]|uniref:DUF5672 domain-containing protein n=1 Tax=Phlyctema vagabunda TaxID=108571 RepID=A0ABR4P2E4_9HELO
MLNRKAIIIAILSLALILTYQLTDSGAVVHGVQRKTKCLFDDAHTPQYTSNTYGQITDKVAVITDNKYTPQLIPLILHFHAVLGPDWPIVFYTSQKIIHEHLSKESQKVSATWQRAIEDKRVEMRVVPDGFNLTSRHGVNAYLSRPWLWEQLAPAQHVLVFQADSILCANSQYKVDDFLEWDFVGAMMRPDAKLYNGGLSLRNRTMMLDILREGHNWEVSHERSKMKSGGEDVWFSKKMEQRGGHLPENITAAQFALQYKWNFDIAARPLGYHKIHRNIPKSLADIAKWCPEIVLAAAGTLGAK